jgi:hypothetical protein
MNQAQKAFALDLIMGRIEIQLDQVENLLKTKPSPFLLGQKSVLIAYTSLWNYIQTVTKPDDDNS